MIFIDSSLLLNSLQFATSTRSSLKKQKPFHVNAIKGTKVFEMS